MSARRYSEKFIQSMAHGFPTFGKERFVPFDPKDGGVGRNTLGLERDAA